MFWVFFFPPHLFIAVVSAIRTEQAVSQSGVALSSMTTEWTLARDLMFEHQVVLACVRRGGGGISRPIPLGTDRLGLVHTEEWELVN